MVDETVERSADDIRGEAADNFFKVAAMAAGTLALLNEHGGAGDDSQLVNVWHSLRGVIDTATAYAEELFD
jgi:hypothetical protein